jgi:hypothetical protein
MPRHFAQAAGAKSRLRPPSAARSAGTGVLRRELSRAAEALLAIIAQSAPGARSRKAPEKTAPKATR